MPFRRPALPRKSRHERVASRAWRSRAARSHHQHPPAGRSRSARPGGLDRPPVAELLQFERIPSRKKVVPVRMPAWFESYLLLARRRANPRDDRVNCGFHRRPRRWPAMPQPPELTSPQTSSRTTVICWIVILASAGYVAGRVFYQQTAPRQADSTHPANDLDLLLTSRVLVGQKQLLADFRQPSPPVHDSLKTLDAKVHSPDDELRAAIVAGELNGA